MAITHPGGQGVIMMRRMQLSGSAPKTSRKEIHFLGLVTRLRPAATCNVQEKDLQDFSFSIFHISGEVEIFPF